MLVPQILNQKLDENKHSQGVCQISRDRSKSRDEIEKDAAIQYQDDMEKFKRIMDKRRASLEELKCAEKNDVGIFDDEAYLAMLSSQDTEGV